MKVGIFGGTFNPPHNGHITAARAFAEAADLDRLLVIPTYLPPHKTVMGVSSDDRLTMTKLAFAKMPTASVSDLEILRGGVSYTAETLTALQNGDDELYLLCGTDMFLSLDTWYQPETVFRLAKICYVKRECSEETDSLLASKEKEYERRYGAHILRIENPAVIELSSSAIRKKVSEKKDFSQDVAPAVYDYILKKGLYL